MDQTLPPTNAPQCQRSASRHSAPQAPPGFASLRWTHHGEPDSPPATVGPSGASKRHGERQAQSHTPAKEKAQRHQISRDGLGFAAGGNGENRT